MSFQINNFPANCVANHIDALQQENQALLQRQKEQQSEQNFLVFKLYGEVMSFKTKSEMEECELNFSNKVLNKQIAQLEKLHRVELDTSMSDATIIHLVFSKITSIVQILQSCKEKYPGHYFSDSIALFPKLREKINEFSKQKMEVYSTSPDPVVVSPIVDMPIVITPNLQVINYADPFLKNEIMVQMEKCELLAKSLAPLRTMNIDLIAKKEGMVEQHKKNLEIMDRNAVVTKILEEVIATNSKIDWTQIVKGNQGMISSACYSPISGGEIFNILDEKIKRFGIDAKIIMDSVISTLELQSKFNKASKEKSLMVVNVDSL